MNHKMKLYLFYQNGIVKIGITKHEDSHVRLKQINSTLPEKNKLQLICEFEVNQNPAMIERLIHEYLGINQLNIQYLKNEMVLVDVDYLHSKQDGSTEFFLADKDKIKQVLTLFGILGYIEVSPNQLKSIDKIEGYSFDHFAGKHSEFLKLCEPVIKNNEFNKNNNNNNKDTLASVMEDLKGTQIVADFCIENNQFYIMLNDKKISIDELTELNNMQYINELLSNKDNFVINKKDGQILYSIIRELRDNNKKTSVQPLTTMQKELKEDEFYEFMEKHDGYKKVKEILEHWFDCGIYAYELLGYESTYNQEITRILVEPDEELSVQQRKDLEKKQKLLNNNKVTSPNFNSPFIFPEYINVINKDDFLFKYYTEHNQIHQSINMIASTYKILYNSKDKEQELKKIENFLDYVDEFYKRLEDNTYKLRSNKSLPELEKSIIEILRNKNYIDLAEAEVKIHGYRSNSDQIEQKTIDKLKKMVK